MIPTAILEPKLRPYTRALGQRNAVPTPTGQSKTRGHAAGSRAVFNPILRNRQPIRTLNQGRLRSCIALRYHPSMVRILPFVIVLAGCVGLDQPVYPESTPSTDSHHRPKPSPRAPQPPEPPPEAGSNTIRVELLRAYMASKSYAAFDFRVTNRSDRDLRALRLYFELFDAKGEYLGRGRGKVQPLASGASALMDVHLGSMDVGQIASWRASINAALLIGAPYLDDKLVVDQR